MPMVTLRPVLLSFVSSVALLAQPALAQPVLAQPVLAQEAPPVANPAPGQQPPIVVIVPQAAPAGDGALEQEAAPAADAAPAPPAEPPVTPIPAIWAPSPKDAEGRTAYGLYLAGRYLAGNSTEGGTEGDGAAGAAYLIQVERLTPEQPRVREQAFTTALLAGNLDDAARIAPSGAEVSPVVSEAGRLVTAVQTYVHGDARAAIAPLKAQPIRAPHANTALLVQPWIAAAAGDWDFALIPPTPGATDVFSQILRFQRAQLLEIHHQDDEAEAEFKVLSSSPLGQAPFRLGYGAFLERRGRQAEAIALYDAALNAGATDFQTRAAKARAEAKIRPQAPPSLRDGAAGGLILGAALATNENANEFAAVYLRLALNVMPNDETRLLLGSTLLRARREAAARDAFAQIPVSDPVAYASARLQIGASLARDDRNEEALAEYRKAAAVGPNSPTIAYAVATQLVQLKREAEALEILNGPLLNTADQGPEIRFVRGAAYEATGDIPKAEAELWTALQAQPDEPAFLNYLGYLWVDSGTRVTEGAAMIAKAHAASPDDGNIQDSLGWAQYRQGQYDTAVVTLEDAVSKEPANAEINDHLGDAYWQVGRKREAGFQWNRVLTLDPDAERRADVEKKLTDGLTPPTPVSGGQP